VLKVKFQKLHSTVVGNVDAADVSDLLLQEGVVGTNDMHKLLMQTDRRQQCRSLLILLHMSEHPQAFVHLYMAIKAESRLQWLVDLIDEFSVIKMVQDKYISEPTGFDMFLDNNIGGFRGRYLGRQVVSRLGGPRVGMGSAEDLRGRCELR